MPAAILGTVHSGGMVLATAVFLACAVEMVEALTVVLAVGATRGWRSALEGAGTALIALVVIAATLGPALVSYVPLDVLRLVVGIVLLGFGAQWLRKAVLRAAGLKAKHDEDLIYEETVASLRTDSAPAHPEYAPGSDRRDGAPGSPRRDGTAFAVAFKGVFLEGVEVIVIVLTLGTASHDLVLAAAAGVAAVLVVACAGALVARQLSEVPENAMKMTVGIMLVSFGTFWVGEGAGMHWPGADLSLVGLIACYAAASAALVWIMARRAAAAAGALDAADPVGG